MKHEAIAFDPRGDAEMARMMQFLQHHDDI
jgi:hypothetical protein